jgi:DNL zinc finger
VSSSRAQLQASLSAVSGKLTTRVPNTITCRPRQPKHCKTTRISTTARIPSHSFASLHSGDSHDGSPLAPPGREEEPEVDEILDEDVLAAQCADVDGTSAGLPIGAIKPSYMIMFTCNVCKERTARVFSKHSYHHGIVLIKCPGCKNLHLIADHRGSFGRKTDIEELLASRGESLTHLKSRDDIESYEFSAEDLEIIEDGARARKRVMPPPAQFPDDNTK